MNEELRQYFRERKAREAEEATREIPALQRKVADQEAQIAKMLEEYRDANPVPQYQLTRSQIRAWMHGEDGGMTPERIALVEEARAAGTIDANS